MHRVELKARREGESMDKVKELFLMHRVELKATYPLPFWSANPSSS